MKYNNEKLKLSAKTFYICCFGGFKTGGTELLHQLAYALNINGHNAVMVYGNDNMEICLDFMIYKPRVISLEAVDDQEENMIIVPETMIYCTRKFQRIQKVIWWLSVDNFTKYEGLMKHIKAYGISHGISSASKALKENRLRQMKYVKQCNAHLCQSHYALEYLHSIGINSEKVSFLSDYINDIYTERGYQYNGNFRKKCVLYNPKKGFEFTQKLIEATPDILWIPLINLSNVEMRELLANSTVYIDFGNHPGKDRIPREAAISGCCIIVGKVGAAQYYDDVKVNEKYKFKLDNSNIPEIIDTIKICMNQYDSVIHDFYEYREMISREKEVFYSDVVRIFGKE